MNNRKKQFRFHLLMLAAALLFFGAALRTEVKAAGVVDLKQTTDSYSSVNVTFTGEGNYFGVRVYTDKNCTKLLKEKVYTASNVGITGLESGSSYWIKVGCGSSMESAYNDLSDAFEIVTKPERMGTVSFVDANEKAVRIQWPASKGAQGYVIMTTDGEAATVSTSYDLPIIKATYAYVYPVRISGSADKDGKKYGAIGSPGYVSGLSCLTMNPEEAMFGLSSQYGNKVGIRTGMINGTVKGTGWEAEGGPVKGSGKKFTLTDKYLYSSGTVQVSLNTMYKYRVRTYVVLSNKTKKYGNWSPYRYFVNPSSNRVQLVGGQKGKISVKWKKLKGVDRVQVYMATSRDGNYKKVASVKAGKKKAVISKFKKKALTPYKSYYVRVFYQTKVKGKYKNSDIVGSRSTYCR